jgi:hypothetical protein
MLTLKNVLIFFAGFECYHALNHAILPFLVDLPLQLKGFVLTPSLNTWGIVINGIIALALLGWASRVK